MPPTSASYHRAARADYLHDILTFFWSGAGEPTGEEDRLPKVTRLFQNYPNPFNPSTTIRFDLPKKARVKLAVYNVKGELVRLLLDEEVDAGRNEVVWNGNNNRNRRVGSGIYFYKLETGNFTQSKKIILLR
ncbi:MAG: T9SS type A sorting domain-containing protein [bacterium]|nr:MAG: T9SS type A sorting domain-containing protein [bacterium]